MATTERGNKVKINIVTLGDMYLGATYDITVLYGAMDHTVRAVFTGVKYNPSDRTYWLYFKSEVAGEIGYAISSVAIADLVEPVKV